MGPAVNLAARIEGLCGGFDRPILFSQDVADLLAEPTTLVSAEILKGNEKPSNIHTIADAG